MVENSSHSTYCRRVDSHALLLPKVGHQKRLDQDLLGRMEDRDHTNQEWLQNNLVYKSNHLQYWKQRIVNDHSHK